MRPNDRPEFTKRWWTSEKPSEIRGADLERALQAVERALADERRGSDARSIDACIAALQNVWSAAEKTIKRELDRRRHRDVITVLERYEGLVEAEVNRLEEAKASQSGADGEEQEEDENKLFDTEYLHKMIKLLKNGGTELRFGFGLNTQAPESSRLVLARKGKPERLFKALKKTGEFNNRLLTYGYALPDPQSGKTLVFRLEESAGEPPQIVKLGRRFLRNDNKLYFRKIKVVLPGGQTVEDDEPDTEEGAQEAATQQQSAAATTRPASAAAADTSGGPPESGGASTQTERRSAMEGDETIASRESAAAATPPDQASADTSAARSQPGGTGTGTTRRSREELQQMFGQIERELEEIMAAISA